MTKHIYTTLVLVCMTIFSHLQAQTANFDSGCIPLQVQFTGPNQSNYFWDFKDGGSSNLQNPEHIFTSAGEYNVELFDSPGGTLVGALLIKVYPDIVVEISTDSLMGCIPLDVQFRPNIIKHPDITVENVIWTFGDGGSSNDMEPIYTYNQAGTYDVSIKVITSVGECNKTVQFDDFITVSGVQAKFNANKYSSCNAPDVFTFTNNTIAEPGLSYEWDFGNGETFTGYQPGPIGYSENGLYEIKLSVTNEAGCVSTTQRNINIGPPVFNLLFDDVVCFNSPSILQNNTVADEFIWEFEENPALTYTATDIASPLITVTETGQYEVKLTAISFLGCTSDTSFTLSVDLVNSNFNVGPEITCGDEFTVLLEAEDLNHQSYSWIGLNEDGSDFLTTLPSATKDYDAPERDSFFVNYPDTLKYQLAVVSEYGCRDTSDNFLVIRKPEAFFVPDQVVGLDNLTVNFQDHSYSEQAIIERIWDWGDGSSDSFTNELEHTHTYGVGEYWVRLTIKNDVGCIDESELILIKVISSDDLLGNIGSATCNNTTGDLQICVGDQGTVVYNNPAPDLIDFHFNTDHGRFNQCWKDDVATHTFLYPGSFTMAFSLEYEGLIFFEDRIGEITIEGAHAKIGYQTDCDNIYNVDFESKSIEADKLEWYINGEFIGTEESFSHTFTSLGRHFVELRAENTSSGCSAHVDTTSVYITDIKADFIVPKNMCDSTMYILDASPSIDVHDICHEGYLWTFEHHRPREVGEDSLKHQFPRGRQSITLTTEDINGCKDSKTKWVNVYGMDPKFPLDSTFCLPHTVQLEDQSIGDTTLIGWEWSFGSTEQNPSYTFTENDLDSLGLLFVGLEVEDAIGCKESVTQLVDLYEPVSLIHVNKGPSVCTGETITFSADDFTEQGSFLTWEWDFQQYGNSTDTNPEITFSEEGTTQVVLTFTEDASGCTGDTTLIINAIAAPVADFMTSADTLEALCHPETIEFTNLSESSGPVFYNWDFGNGITSGLEDPAISYDKGIYTATMIVRSVYGCADTLMQTFELIGPEGNALIDKSDVCIGEEISLSIIDTVDVNSFTWDFGDGITADDISPATHAYDLPSDQTNVSLILRSTDTGCELVQTIPINLHNVFADFALLNQTGFCNGSFTLENLSLGANTYEWLFENQTHTGPNPSFDYETPGAVNVSLTVTDNTTGCQHTNEKEIMLVGIDEKGSLPNVFSPNNDSRNDYFNVVTAPGNEDSVEIIEFKIYNRWGELIYNNDTPQTGWNGFYKNQIAPAEVYSYYIEYSVDGCNNKNEKGNITLVR